MAAQLEQYKREVAQEDQALHQGIVQRAQYGLNQDYALHDGILCSSGLCMFLFWGFFCFCLCSFHFIGFPLGRP